VVDPIVQPVIPLIVGSNTLNSENRPVTLSGRETSSHTSSPLTHSPKAHQNVLNFQGTDKQIEAAAIANPSRYSQVHVLLIHWEDDLDRGASPTEIAELAKIFKDLFQFNVEIWGIPKEQSHLKVHSKVLDFALNAKTGDLLIIYYAGGGKLSKHSQLTWTRYVSMD